MESTCRGYELSNAIQDAPPCHSASSHDWHIQCAVKFYHVVKCRQCGLMGTRELLSSNYGGIYNVDERNESMFLAHILPARKVTWARFLNRLESFRKSGTLLEIGSGYGHFLLEAQRHGWQAQGVEPSVYSSWVAKNCQRVQVSPCTLEELPTQKCDFDLVVLWDVIEHIADFRALLTECRNRLRPGGGLLLRTPDARVFLMRPKSAIQRLWLQAYIQLVYPANPREHIYHFTPKVLASTVKAVGLSVSWVDVETLPGEIITHGRNFLITAAKRLTAWATQRSRFPYEFTLLAQKSI